MSNNTLNSDKLWDEILKAIVERMPNQLLPLIEDVFDTTYPSDVSIELLHTENTIPSDKSLNKLTSIYSDIAILINGTDIYHLESQMKNEDNMCIRMIKYDFHLALSNSLTFDENGYTLDFPKSVVIYPAPNKNIPNQLTCHINFADGSSHDYTVPTVRIESYDLEKIRQKHLTLFLPFKLLKFRPRLHSKTNPLTPSELTEFVSGIIFILGEELRSNRISSSQYEDYIDLIDKSADRVFKDYSDFKEQVITMTKSLITLPSEKYENYEKQLAEKDAILAEKDSILAEKDDEIKELKKKLEELQK